MSDSLCPRYFAENRKEVARELPKETDSEFKLKLTLDAFLLDDSCSENTSSTDNHVQTEEPDPPLKRPNFAPLFDKEEYADICFEFPFEKNELGAPKRIVAHRLVMSLSSRQIFNLLRGEWSRRKISVTTFTYDAFRRFVIMLYSDELSNSTASLGDLIHIIPILIHYQIDDLLAHCSQQFKNLIEMCTDWNELLLALSSQRGLPLELQAEMVERLKSFFREKEPVITDESFLCLLKFAHENNVEELFEPAVK